MICEDFVRFLLIVRKRKITKRRNRNGVIVLSLFFYVTGPYEEVPYRRLRSAFSHVLLALTQTRKIAFRLYVRILTELGSGLKYSVLIRLC